MRTNIRLATPFQPAPDPLDELLGNRSSLDTPLPVTFFPDRFARIARRETLSLRDMAERSQSTRAPEKDALPLWKLATFGDVRTEKGSLRHDDNLAQITGVEGDHDAGTMTPEEAAERLRAAGIAALVHTTPSHRPDAPRWRVLCPLAQPVAKEVRRALVERLNDALGGVLASESFTPSQAFYFGATEGQDAPETHLVDGRCIDAGAPTPRQAAPRRETLANLLGDDDDPDLWADYAEAKREREWEPDRIRSALRTITDASDRDTWLQIGMALHHASGGADAGYDLWCRWSRRCPEKFKERDQRKTWKSFGRRGGGVTIASLYQIAKGYGWNPAAPIPGSDDDLAALLGTSKPAAPLPAESKGEKVGLIRARNGDLKATLHNAVLMLRKVNRDHDYHIRLNDMTGREEWQGGPIGDGELGAFRVAMEQAGMHNVGADLTASAVRMVAQRDRYHPVRDWLNGLSHDGRPRLDTWLTRYLGVEDSPYVRAVGRAFLIAMVARVMRPGCKHDHVLVLKGGQGARKSTACRILAGDAYFSDTMPAIRNDKIEAWRHLRGKWLVELAELAPSRRADQEDLKSFLSGQVDSYRQPWDRLEEAVPRQCVFVGTTNEDAFLRDATGGRRFWPVTCGEKIDAEALAEDREQLFAEAVAAFHEGEAWHLSPEMERLAAVEQEAAREEDPWEGLVERALVDLTGDSVTTADLLWRTLGIPSDRQTPANSQRVARIMRKIGWTQRRSGNVRAWWRP